MRTIGSGDVNEYIRDAAGGEFTAKDFRTWAGTVIAVKFLVRKERPDSQNACKRVITAMLGAVSEELGNTPAVCRKCYVHPRVTEAWSKRFPRPSRCIRGLSREESLTLRLIQPAK